MKLKKWYFILGAVLALVIVAIILCFTAFSLKTVSIDYRTSHPNISQMVSDKEIIEGGKFKKGKPVFFQNKKQYSKNIENFNPYIKVINIETIFPSKMVVHIAERQEVFAVKGKIKIDETEEECFYICDEQLRVLRIDIEVNDNVENEDVKEDNIENNDIENDNIENIKKDKRYNISTKDNPILIDNQISKQYKEGDYIKEIRKPSIYDALFENNRHLGEQQSLIEKLKLTKEYDKQLKKDIGVTELKLFSGQTFKIFNDNYSMKYKAKLLIDVFGQIYDFVGKEYKLGEKTEDNKKYEIYVKLTKEYLSNCEIIISNYYNYNADFGVSNYKDCFFKFDIDESNAEEKGLEIIKKEI